jgi:hypothetical protein
MYQPEIAFHLIVPPDFQRARLHHLGIEQQRQAAGQHEHDGDPVDGGLFEVGHGRIMGRIAAGGECRHGMVDGVEGGHSGPHVSGGAGGGERDIGERQQTHEFTCPGHEFLAALGAFELEQLHAADAQEGQHEDRHHHHAEAADPLDDRAPQENAGRKRIQTGNDGGAGGGKAGY